MAKKPIFKTLWAERGVKEEVDSSKIAVGWTAERPPFQWENWSQWRQDAFISHINEKGLPEWDDFTAYGTSGKSYVLGSNGEVYVSTAPSGGTYPASDPSEATTTKWKKAWLDSDGTIGIPRVVGLVAALDNKVDKVVGKALSANDFTNAYKGKLDGIESNAQRNVATNLSNKRAASSITLVSSTGEGTIIPTASATLAGVLSGTDKAKLDSLPSGVDGIVPLSGGGTGSSNAAGARLALQLGNHSTHNYGTTANTVMMGNDSRVVRVNQDIAEGLATKADKSINISTGVGLSGGGNLSTNRTISTIFGTTANTSAMGNDSRIINGQTSFERLDIGKTAATARAALGLGAGATRWPSFSEVTGLGTAATKNVGTGSGNVMEVGAFGAGHIFSAAVFDANKIADQVGGRSGFYPHMSNIGGTNVPHTYVYIQQLFYSSNGNVTQIAYGYNIEAIWIRYRYQGVWSPWVKQLTTSDMPTIHTPIGVGQRWQAVSRGKGTTYTNSTGKPIQILVEYQDVGSWGNATFRVGGLTRTFPDLGSLGPYWFAAVIPHGNTYSITGGGLSLGVWWELR